MLVIGCSSEDAPTATSEAGEEVGVNIDVQGHVITRWRSDQFSLGSYSYLAKGSIPADRQVLAEPIDGRVFFAGEAIHRAFPATVHGAYESGVDAADQTLDASATSVVIIGAGSAGLAAAKHLRENGVDDVVVVEGRSWVGGRVHTNHSLGTAVDLGASWIHGIDGNVLTKLADEAGIERVPTDYDNIAVINTAGATLPWSELPQELVDVLEIENEYAADIEQLSEDAPNEGAEFGGGDVLFPNGYSELMEFIAQGTDVRLDTIIRSVTHDGDGVIIRSDDEQWDGDAVIVTVPLGVLKAGSIEFTPALPARKLDVIDRLGMGHLSKVYLRFSEVFWDADIELFGFSGPHVDQFPLWVNYAAITGQPILMAFHGGTAADELERKDDDQIVAEAVAVLRQMFGSR